jgi:hypothetical protein
VLFRASLWLDLATYRVANVFDCFSNFPSGLAEAFFYFAARIVGATFVGEFIVIDSLADSFLGFAFSLIPFSFNFIPVW